MKYSAIALCAGLVLASTPALAGRNHHANHDARFTAADMRSADRALDQRDEMLERRMTTMRIGAMEREQIADQRQEIRKLRHRLHDGQSIDRYTLYRALGGASHPIYFDSDLS